MTAAYDRAWSLAIAEGDAKVVFVGRESGALEKHDAAGLGAAKPAQLVLTGHSGAITGIIAASADEVTTCGVDGTLRTWNTAAEVEGKREGKAVKLPAAARCMILSGDATFVGLANGDIVKIEGGAVSATLTGGHDDAVAALAVSETALFSASYDGSVRGWDLASNAPFFVFRGHSAHVKGVAVVNGTSLVACGRDDKVCVWNIPAEGPSAAGGGEAAAEAEGGAEGAEGGAADAAPASGKAPAAAEPIVVDPVGVLELPMTPHSLVAVGGQLVLTGADGSVRGLTAKALLKEVADYFAGVESSCAQAARQIASNTAIKVKNAKRIAKRKVKQSRAAIAAEEAAKAGAAPKPKAAAADEEGEAEAAEAEAEGEGDEDAGPKLSEEGQKALDEATAAANAECEAAIAAANAAKAEQLAKLAPLRKQRWLHKREKFATCVFATTFRGPRSEPAITAVADGNATAIVAAGAEVAPVTCRVGVQAL